MRYALILRAVNVGRHNRIRMDTLRQAVSAAGFRDVRSHLQTGNLTLDADEAVPLAVAEQVEDVLMDLGLRGASVVARAWSDIEQLATSLPFQGHEPAEHRFTVSFCRSDIPDLPTTPWTDSGLTFVGGTDWALFAVIPRDLARAPNANAIIERRWGIAATTRFWNVITDWVAREDT